MLRRREEEAEEEEKRKRKRSERRTAIRARTERSENERIGDRLPAMEKRIELEKRGKKPGDVRQPSDFFYCAAHRPLPIFISTALSSPSSSLLPPRARVCVSLVATCGPLFRVFRTRLLITRPAHTVDQRAFYGVPEISTVRPRRRRY